MEIINFLNGWKGWFRRKFYTSAMAPAIHVVAVNDSRPNTWDALTSRVRDAVGFTILEENKAKYTMTIKCEAKRKYLTLF
jgi:hypothetical protein